MIGRWKLKLRICKAWTKLEFSRKNCSLTEDNSYELVPLFDSGGLAFGSPWAENTPLKKYHCAFFSDIVSCFKFKNLFFVN